MKWNMMGRDVHTTSGRVLWFTVTTLSMEMTMLEHNETATIAVKVALKLDFLFQTK